MNEEISGTPTEAAVDHVSISDGGVIMLSPEALDAMAGIETPVESTKLTEEAKPAEISANEAIKIKWNGQEVEVPKAQEVELLQKGYNYEQKMAQLESERAKLTAYNGLVSAIEASPEIRSKVSQALGYQQQPTQPEVPQFDDPIEQLKWEVRQETLKEVEARFIQPIKAQNQAQAHQQALNAVKAQVQADPLFGAVQEAIINQVKSMPQSIGQDLYRRLDRDPQAYMEMYNIVRAKLPSTTSNPSAAESPQPSKRETKAPLLESGSSNTAPPDAEAAKAQREHIKNLERKAKDGDFRAIGELFELMA